MQARYEAINEELRCLVCQNQTIADSNAGLAVDLRRQVREMLLAGKSDKEIMEFMTQRYGDFVTYRPPFTPRTYLLWLAPLILVLVGLAVIISIVRKRSALPIDESDEFEVDEGESDWT
ncbi:MAG: cytochrome c-type biogenesis protein [Pseudomonadota bacterium]